ncbi:MULTISPECIES: hypothetical protein [Neobacillus]|uniref:Uncharacterized protein n=1 Tax=Neobacillus thermocopriae TaxID=1215031 RepID=A0A6B3TT68_9BACI|nr:MULTISPECIES: hypothetical protein [Neobacillus]MED3623511.1 hypothetical protein [Neobacillus thermocopriae]MED3715257.1 hypothetical protein [Neobacillus thermocopriae]NEX79536.1 hypothetical protein [Neobacillus thermocopriae]
MEFQEEEKHPVNDVDPFTKLMFGSGRVPIKVDKYHSNESFDREEHFEESFLGKRRIHKAPFMHHQPNQIQQLLNQIDLELLIGTIDTAMQTYKQYQPLIKEVSPFLKKFLKKG